MGRTSIKNQLILSFLALLFIVVAVVGVVNRMSNDFYLAQAISTALALAAGIIFGSIFSGSLVNRLNSLSNVAREISHGDLSRDISLSSRDEIRDLEEAFAGMVDDLRGMLLDLKSVTLQIGGTNTSLSKLVRKALASSHEIDNTARAIAKSSEEQTVIVQKTSLSLDNGLEEMDDMVRQSSETVSKVNAARQKTEQGEAKARQAFEHLEQVLKQMAEHTQPIFRLAGKVDRIKLITNIMDDIAQKTDLLSLNASIEATRAGESGRGFAIVADEIRNMAANSKRSSQEIRDMVEDMLEDNQAVTMALTRSQDGINQGRETIHGLLTIFNETLGNVKEASHAIQEIETVTTKLVRQMRGPLSHFKELSRLANENFLFTQKTTVATRSQKEDMVEMVEAMKALNSLSERMTEAQRRFVLHNQDGTPERNLKATK
ncbi:MAG: methyl-accepting chemotaxis protein [Deltaproteobacteria bacterium]|nr:methyl-accepting chemotaxis protein [Deltaproteobacteria bacterium]